MHALAGLPLASFKRRAFAFLIDSALVSVISSPFEIAHLIRTLTHLEGHAGHEVMHFAEHANELFFTLLYFGLATWKFDGRTLGKRWMKIRVVSLVHRHISLWQALERTLGYGASALEGGFGFFQYFMNPNHLCVHDRIAETIVVSETPELMARLDPQAVQQ